jgi:hypothetical protein
MFTMNVLKINKELKTKNVASCKNNCFYDGGYFLRPFLNRKSVEHKHRGHRKKQMIPNNPIFTITFMPPYQPDLRTVDIVRYITPLREGGSLPAIVSADDDFSYVLKFRGAGQGIKALIAELIGGEIARALGLNVPEIVLATVDPAFGRTEPDEEIQDLLKFSEGLNLGLHFLSGALTYDPVATPVDQMTASKIVWLDSLITNVDRTARNTNMLLWRGELWLIDHGAALYFHHSWDNWESASRSAFPQVKDHVLLKQASSLDQADEDCRRTLTPQHIHDIVAAVPDEWMALNDEGLSATEKKEIYTRFLINRLESSSTFLKAARDAREAIV